MNKENKFFEDFTKLAGSAMDTAFNSFADMKSQFDHAVHEKVDELLKKHDLVSREEFEVVRQMAQKARLEQEKLSKKITALEKKLKENK
ncbi:MAG: accessory factor UbiK family protein [Rickettsiales bacterium]|nr:accessory factor UbiK family protein [Pseudomonadota bacterium]MDA0967030.1 accessory factor UbiK family protein [Pseudomonadota bacterium]MDG4542484.1 accessory factor UbiK family protein [Rickettsiales bacterium]MDG4544988.1 accessory factor UbiK family protein [Rickettsiales bacterium]MDG4547111.1 accessory factor UbiK family protein [Rickettsiales bacterium]